MKLSLEEQQSRLCYLQNLKQKERVVKDLLQYTEEPYLYPPKDNVARIIWYLNQALETQFYDNDKNYYTESILGQSLRNKFDDMSNSAFDILGSIKILIDYDNPCDYQSNEPAENNLYIEKYNNLLESAQNFQIDSRVIKNLSRSSLVSSIPSVIIELEQLGYNDVVRQITEIVNGNPQTHGEELCKRYTDIYHNKI